MSTFERGIHTDGHKSLSEDKAIERMPAPAELRIPVCQHIGGACTCLVRPGDTVKKGQLIAQSDARISANIYSPVNGTVKEIREMSDHTGIRLAHVVLENDFTDGELTLEPIEGGLTQRQALDRIRAAGVVGMGGAAFPVHVKLEPQEDKPVDTLLINGAECEPYITCDYRIMLDYTEQLIEGAKLIQIACGAQRLVFAVEDNKPRAISALQAAGVEVCVLKTKYPQGAERQLIHAVTRRKVPAGGLPRDIGVLVDNVHTALSVYYAVRKGRTVYERVLTVSGTAVKEPRNLWVATGTPIADVLAHCGGLTQDPRKVISGGPMMGYSQHTLDAAVTKASTALLFLAEDEVNLSKASACINCGKCARSCPMRLMPMYIDSRSIAGDFAGAKEYYAMDCIECGCCSYVCPAKRPLVQSIRLAKKLIKARNI